MMGQTQLDAHYAAKLSEILLETTPELMQPEFYRGSDGSLYIGYSYDAILMMNMGMC